MESAVLLLLAAPVTGLAANVLTQLVLSRPLRKTGHLRLQFCSIFVGALVTVVTLLLVGSSYSLPLKVRIDHSVANFGSYLLLSFCFFNLVSSLIGSLRIRLLLEYERVDPDPIPEDQLRFLYPLEQMLDVRLERLARGGQIRVVGGKYLPVSGFVHYVGVLFVFLRVLLLAQQRRAPER